MGVIAELMLLGVLCEFCGSYIGAPVGHPRYCEDCNDD